MRPNFVFCLLAAFMLFLMPLHELAAQTACFRFLSDSLGCVPFRVRLQSCSQAPITSIAYNFDFQKDSTFANFVNFPIDTFVYRRPGTYKIVQDIGQGKRFTRFVVVRDTAVAPNIQINICANKQLFFKISDQIYNYFLISYGDGNSRLVRSNDTSWVYQYSANASNNPIIRLEGKYLGSGCGRAIQKNLVLEQTTIQAAVNRLEWRGPDSLQISYVAKGPPAASARLLEGRPLQPTGAVSIPNPYIFRANAATSLLGIGLNDYCNNQSVSIPAAPIRISNLQSNTNARGSYLKLDWTYNPQNMQGVFEGFYIYRNNILAYIGASTMRSFLDSSNINCKGTYSYRIEAHWKLSGSFDLLQKSISQTESIRLQTGLLSAISVFGAGYQDNQLVLHWQLPPQAAARQIVVNNLTTSISTTLPPTDTMIVADQKPSRPSCYTIFWTDSCDNKSAVSAPICPIWLSQPDTKNPFLLNWTNYSPMPAGLSNYKLIIWGSGNSGSQTIEMNGQNSYQQSQPDDQNQIIRYQICVMPTNGRQSCSNVIEIRQPLVALLPDAFTPNNDSYNDSYMGVFKFVAKSNLKILDRWGKVIFRQTNPTTGWDGTDNGQPVLPGVYVVVLELTDQTGRSYNFTKNIALIR